MAEERRKKPRDITETDLAQDVMGNNQLQGDDQSRVRNERKAVPGVRPEADENIAETLDKTDKDVRARRDLGKGQGVHRKTGNN